ncbi:MAG: hypothetical protein E7324_02640 [Clostridiales bacterium]|nr:hypothetical protein [Clostridiales bacterium]
MKHFLCGLTALLMLCSFVYAQAHHIWTEEETISLIKALDAHTMIYAPAEKRIITTQRDLCDIQGLDERRLNILLMSSNAPDMRENFGKAEAILILSLHMDTGEMRLLSLQADALITVDKLPIPIPLKYVACFGGPNLMIRTLNQTLGLNIRRYCAVNMQAFAACVDALNGIPLSLTEEEQLSLGLDNPPQYLTGNQAYQFIRSAKGSGTAGRAIRVMQSAGRRLIDTFSLGTALHLAGALLPLIDCNLNMIDIGRLLGAFLRNSGFTPHSLGAEEPIINQRPYVHAFLYGEENP